MNDYKVKAMSQGYKYVIVVIDEETGKVMEYWDQFKDERYREKWSRAGANEYGRLFQGTVTNRDGTQRVEGTNTCRWIPKLLYPDTKR